VSDDCRTVVQLEAEATVRKAELAQFQEEEFANAETLRKHEEALREDCMKRSELEYAFV